MKVTVIGSGNMWVPSNSACYLIDDDIMVDFPNGAGKYLLRFGVKPEDINHILVTHFHIDHYFDIPFYVCNKAKNNKKNTNVYCYEEGKEKLNELGLFAFNSPYGTASKESDLKFNHSDIFNINDYKVERLLVDHGKLKPAYGYIITNNDISIGFTGDTSLCNSIEEMASKCKYLFCDCAFIKGTETHMGIDNINYLSNKYPDCIFVTSHMADETREELLKQTKPNIIVPNDGQIISIK